MRHALLTQVTTTTTTKKKKTKKKARERDGDAPLLALKPVAITMAGGFLAVPLQRTLAVNPGTPYVKYLYVRRQDDDSLFVLNPSVDDDQNSLSRFFSRWAPVSSVDMGAALSGVAPFARVHFKDPAAAKRVAAALADDVGQHGVLEPDEGVVVGKAAMDRWIEEARAPARTELGRQADRVVAAYDDAERAAAEERERQASAVDAEGFVKVVSKKKRRAVAQPSSSSLPRDVKKTKREVLHPGFYKFEKMDKRKEELRALQSKHEKAREAIRRQHEVLKPL